ncbi:MAG: acetyl-CoA carboxylase carboxyl transferase subunit alpha [Glaciecola sp.]|jgi:acetyl-CoA carboxylase carboxyl transferase subunit alpha|uniref:acetyl-CoA carboxylase carboxyltransferase subunit alpha n=1 Tax=Congregibacter sp. TaxID=2744308 RepID=UPI0039E6FDB4
MNPNYLDFEQPIAELEVKIEELRHVGSGAKLNLSSELGELKAKSAKLTEKIFSNLSPWDVVRVARHPLRPYTLDYLPLIFDDFDELHGDRHFGDDKAIVGGIARLKGESVMVIGQEKGRSVKDKVFRNFGMPKPEGYRKALRLMETAERFSLPVVTLIDTPGAYPGIDSEERGISESIATNLAVMSRLKTPIVSVVIGEGSSGGALGIGVADHLAMLQYATYFVISPEGCANIIWKSSEFASEAAAAMGVTSEKLKELGIVDASIPEPLGGAHRDAGLMAERIRDHVAGELDKLKAMSTEDMLEARYARLLAYGN